MSCDKIDVVIAKKRFRDCGVKIVYVAESIPEDDEAAQIIMESLYEAMAESFIIGHRKNVMRGLNGNAKDAIYNGVVILGYIGKPNEHYKIDENNNEKTTIVILQLMPNNRKIYSQIAEWIIAK